MTAMIGRLACESFFHEKTPGITVGRFFDLKHFAPLTGRG
jgi:hypothetical protein